MTIIIEMDGHQAHIKDAGRIEYVRFERMEPNNAWVHLGPHDSVPPWLASYAAMIGLLEAARGIRPRAG